MTSKVLIVPSDSVISISMEGSMTLCRELMREKREEGRGEQGSNKIVREEEEEEEEGRRGDNGE